MGWIDPFGLTAKPGDCPRNSLEHDNIAHGGYFSRKEQRRSEYEAKLKKHTVSAIKQKDLDKLLGAEKFAAVTVSSFKEADTLLHTAFPNALKFTGPGPGPIKILSGMNKEELIGAARLNDEHALSKVEMYRKAKSIASREKDSKDTIIFHKDYLYDNEEGILHGHSSVTPEDHPHRHIPHINIEGYKDGKYFKREILIDRKKSKK
ncbi:hypothetical protein [Hahella sp. KA22]|uniref:hypothetical protein n=1 Tax=Hahella sp. KA22 TaxID=1628392 RepID=UPI00352C1EED